MKKAFVKMQGCGNDYIYFDCTDGQIPADMPQLSIRLSDRHFGIGGDGVILICPSETADARMRIFNADGSEGKMCGNGVRCVGKYLYERLGVRKDVLTVETLSGVKMLRPVVTDGAVNAVSVDMGPADFSASVIPFVCGNGETVGVQLTAGGNDYTVTCLSMGNPHCVVFCEDPLSLDLEKIGPTFERHPAFPESVNTEFVRVLDPDTLQMRVWERGSGETMACGTGACAAVAAAVANGLCGRNRDIEVKLPGGDLIIRIATDTVWMTGPAVTVFAGEAEI